MIKQIEEVNRIFIGGLFCILAVLCVGGYIAIKEADAQVKVSASVPPNACNQCIETCRKLNK